MKGRNKEPIGLQPNPKVIVDLPVDQLLLDSENPRLAWRAEKDSQEGLLKVLWVEMAVDEVAWSIAENGFFRSEPLFVIIDNPSEQDMSRRAYTVVEGNRRLAAVRLLRDGNLRKKIGATDLPEITTGRRASLNEIPAIIYPDRESLWTTVGFRHINGIKPWDSFSKAEYIAEVYETYGIPLDEIARKIGDRHTTVKRLYRGFKLLEQAEHSGVFDKEDRVRNRFYFSHLYTAVDYREFRQFLGVEPETSLEPNPVPEARLSELREFMEWLYGKKSAAVEPVVRTQNPDLNHLRKVIAKPDSLSVLRRTGNLEIAYNVAVGDRQRFRDALTNAKVELQNAKATVTTGYSGEDDLFETIDDILLYAESIYDEMGSKRGSNTRTEKIGKKSARRRS